ncbi:MAG: hypothetical protein U1E06_13145 [Tabrizicola sp.]|uniref:hypothetical protein n=1 Tax=Tabrizicola sp. TaxID=2005166 RepID=UPI002732CABE|nr:hypothetical protein [Tabrizicola sp.]MDP3261438.1 hypothetical protein [Tabrizicola sp.]MDP3649227.1 hypothetical protein [Paracoccaceae bacterium]MDZ4067771.1 hypothetical protein [Tabrizicola sp.]
MKYAGGTLDILRTDNPLFRKGLTLPHRLMHGVTFYSHLSALWNVVFIVWPIIFLFTGLVTVATRPDCLDRGAGGVYRNHHPA